MPPGPFPLPVIGNMLQLDIKSGKPFHKLYKTYGDIMTLQLHKSTVFVNTASLARKAKIEYSNDVVSREIGTPLYKVVGPNDVVFAEYGKAYMFRKRVFKSAMHVFGAGIKAAEERGLHAVACTLEQIKTMKDQPFSPKNIIGSAIVVQLWQWLTAEKISLDDPVIVKLLEFNDLVAKKIPSTFLIHRMIPFYSYLPIKLSKFVKRGQNIKFSILSPVLQSHLETYTPGTIRNMTDSFIEAYKKEAAKESKKDIGSINDIKDLMIDVTLAGSDTTSSSLSWFILYMTLYPETQQKIHEEIVHALGRDKLPRMDDADNMPYLQATICEVVRKTSPVPRAGTVTINDVELAGYHIPKGTTIIVNIAEIHKDEREWLEPHKFKPERFLDEDGKFVGWTKYPAFMPFGLGRRECAGISFAKIMLFTFTAALLQQLKFELPEGAERPAEDGPHLGIVNGPENFQVIMRKRF
ncbi:cytochrome P450 2D4-like isoform X2 [Xenia sp. Carnegie-2017]|nr:cytochrome P450 2D4-like isoform X2 [Xenia sp. Carnegie-2017]